jgi:hypothetical protein
MYAHIHKANGLVYLLVNSVLQSSVVLTELATLKTVLGSGPAGCHRNDPDIWNSSDNLCASSPKSFCRSLCHSCVSVHVSMYVCMRAFTYLCMSSLWVCDGSCFPNASSISLRGNVRISRAVLGVHVLNLGRFPRPKVSLCFWRSDDCDTSPAETCVVKRICEAWSGFLFTCRFT